jgi:hypothetical protein
LARAVVSVRLRGMSRGGDTARNASSRAILCLCGLFVPAACGGHDVTLLGAAGASLAGAAASAQAAGSAGSGGAAGSAEGPDAGAQECGGTIDTHTRFDELECYVSTTADCLPPDEGSLRERLRQPIDACGGVAQKIIALAEQHPLVPSCSPLVGCCSQQSLQDQNRCYAFHAGPKPNVFTDGCPTPNAEAALAYDCLWPIVLGTADAGGPEAAAMTSSSPGTLCCYHTCSVLVCI